MFSTLKLAVAILVDRIFTIIVVWKIEMVREGQVVGVCGHLNIYCGNCPSEALFKKERNDTASSELKICEILVGEHILQEIG